MKNWFAIVISCFVLSGCAIGDVRNENMDYALVELQGAVDRALPLGKRNVSPNGREFESNYFLLYGSRLVRAANAKKRHYAKVWVLGDRRPYTLAVTVYTEARASVVEGKAIYRVQTTDQRIARLLIRKIETEVKKRSGERNVIDDFRVF